MTTAAEVSGRTAAPLVVAACCGPAAAATTTIAYLDSHDWDRVTVAVLGQRGSGRSRVLRQVRDAARKRGTTVLAADAADADGRLLAVFQQLFGRGRTAGTATPIDTVPRSARPVFESALGWSSRQSEDLTSEFQLLAAALTQLRAMTAHAPVLILLDDACLCRDDLHRFFSRLLDSLPHRVSIVRAALADTNTAPRGRPTTTDPRERLVTVAPWCTMHAARHLDDLPRPPQGVVRLRLLSQAAGNPLALTELGRRAADNPQWARPGLPFIPLPQHLVEAFAPGLSNLAVTIREGLAVAAAARGDLHVIRTVTPDAKSDPDWVAAWDSGWVYVRGRRLHFRHPMLRAAAYHAVSPSRMRILHRRIAAAVSPDINRSTWHHAVGGAFPEEALAANLERIATRLTAAGAATAAIEMLSMAAAVTPELPERERRLRVAAHTAQAIDQSEWAETLAGAPPSTWPEPEPTPTTLRSLRVQALSEATDDVYRSGQPARPDILRQIVTRQPEPRHVDLEPAVRSAVEGVDATLWLWAAALLDPATHRDAAAAVLQDPDLTTAMLKVAGVTATPRNALDRAVGKSALLLDETGAAIDRLSAATAATHRTAPERDAGEALVWALSDAGQMREALEWARRIERSRPRTVWDRPAVGARVAREVLGGWISSTPENGFRNASVLFDPAEEPHLAVRLWRAEAAATAAAGRHDDAWRHLRQLWRSDGIGHHAVLSDLAIGDLAAAAAHTQRNEEARSTLRAVESRHGAGASLRQRLALHRARALLADDEEAEHHFRLSLVHPGGAAWPHERAIARLDYAEWLRRAQRPADARPQLQAALETFTAIGLPLWSERAAHELATASSPRSASHEPGALTLQQRKIADLAAQGLTNRQIADHLFLSVRTVTTHMTHVFRSLGIQRRMHLAEALADLDRQ